MKSSFPQYKQSLSCLIPKRHNSFLVTIILCKNLLWNPFNLFSLQIYFAKLKICCHSLEFKFILLLHFFGPVGNE